MAKRGRKNAARLARRIKAWDELPHGSAIHGGRVKIVNGQAFRQPGSESK